MLSGSKYAVKKTYYEILSVREDATYEEIRAGYKSAALSSHPDKLLVKQEGSEEDNSGDELQDGFLSTQRAWEVLRDPASRAEYDGELRELRHELGRALDEVSLEDMELRDAGDGGSSMELFLECRCGDCFSITCSELEVLGVSIDGDGGAKAGCSASLVLLPCGSCSLRILLVIDGRFSAGRGETDDQTPFK